MVQTSILIGLMWREKFCLVVGGCNYFFYFQPILGEMIQFDEHIFQMGWFNQQLEIVNMNWEFPQILPSHVWGPKL